MGFVVVVHLNIFLSFTCMKLTESLLMQLMHLQRLDFLLSVSTFLYPTSRLHVWHRGLFTGLLM
jgi:hypothetical protein